MATPLDGADGEALNPWHASWNSNPAARGLYDSGTCVAFKRRFRHTREIPTVRMVHCVKLNKEAEGLDFPSLSGELSRKLWQSILKEAWAGRLKHRTMLTNENRPNMADPRARQYLPKQTEKCFFGDSVDEAAGYVPPPSA